MIRRSKRLVGAVLLSMVLVSVMAPSAAVALDNRSQCFQNYGWCMFDASLYDSWWRRIAAGADCYVDLVACVRRALFG